MLDTYTSIFCMAICDITACTEFPFKEWVPFFLRSWEMNLGETHDKSHEPQSGSRNICHNF